MTPLRILYLALAVIGALWPLWHFTAYLTSEGASFAGLFAQWTAGPAVTGMAIDLMIAGVATLIWIVVESTRRRHWLGLLAIPGLCVAVSCGLPLYLFLRSFAPDPGPETDPDHSRAASRTP